MWAVDIAEKIRKVRLRWYGHVIQNVQFLELDCKENQRTVEIQNCESRKR